MSIQDLIKQKKRDMQAKKASSIRTIKPASGKHTYRLLPSWRLHTEAPAGTEWTDEEKLQFWHDFAIHYIKQPGSKKVDAAYVCAEKTFDKPCDVCMAIGQSIKAADDDDTIEALKQANASQRYLVNVLHRSGDNPEEVQLMELGVKVFEQILEIIGEWGDITDLDAGMDISITREGTGMDTKYTALPAAKSKPVDKSVLEKLINIDDVVAQENEAKKQLALGSLGKIVGILPPTGSAPSHPGIPDMSEAEEGEWSEEAGQAAETLSQDDEDELNDLLSDLG